MSINRRFLSILLLAIYSMLFITACAYHDRPGMMPDMIPVRPRVKAHEAVPLFRPFFPPCRTLLMLEDGQTLVSSGRQSHGWRSSFETKIWDATSTKVRNVIDHEFPVVCSEISADGTVLAISVGNEVKIYDLVKATVIHHIELKRRTAISMSINRRTGDLVAILALGCERELVSWDLKSYKMKVIRKFDCNDGISGLPSPILSPSGDLIAWMRHLNGFESQHVEVWKIEGWRPMARIKTLLVPSQTILSFSRDGHWLAVLYNKHKGRTHRSIFTVDVGNETILAKRVDPMPFTFSKLDGGSPFLSGTSAFSWDGKVLAAGTRRNGVVLWDVSTLKQLAYIRALNDDAKQNTAEIEFSPDGRTLYVLNEDGDLRIWDITGITDSGP